VRLRTGGRERAEPQADGRKITLNTKGDIMKIEQFKNKQYLNIETFRKSGEGVKTPVWFVENNGKLFIQTMNESGKAKRIRRNTIVNVAPCRVGGEVLGTWITAEARLFEDITQIQEIDKFLNKKYGLMKKLFELGGSRNKQNTIAIEISFQG
jgi:PPOX class probable F420-dependent enzyme